MHWSPCPRRPAPRACWTTGCSPRAPACASASCATAGAPWPACCAPAWAWASCPPAGSPPWACAPSGAPIPKPLSPPCRSEEHTSELQSPCNLVCRLLLEKKKQERIGRRVPPARQVATRRDERAVREGVTRWAVGQVRDERTRERPAVQLRQQQYPPQGRS